MAHRRPAGMGNLTAIVILFLTAFLLQAAHGDARGTTPKTKPTPPANDYEDDPERAFLRMPSPPPTEEAPLPPRVRKAAVAAGGNQGRWSDIITFPLVPVAGALVSDTKLLTWSSYSPTTFSGPHGYTLTATLDLTKPFVKPPIMNVSNTGHDMFCPGISALADGKIIVTGGDDDQKTSVYNPATGTWIPGTDMVKPRGYQASATLSDGRVFLIGGSWSGGSGGKNGEVWSAGKGWKAVPGCTVGPMLTKDADRSKQDAHAKLFAWGKGKVFQAGPSSQLNWYDPDGNGGVGATVTAGTRGTDPDAMNGNAVMFDAGSAQILTVGGATSYTPFKGTVPIATANANIINVPKYGKPAKVEQVAPMKFARAFSNAVVLPDGKVLVIGGQARPVIFTDGQYSVMTPELWNPTTRTWTSMADMAVPRNYHSIAVLLPDGRVFSGGGGLCGRGCKANHFDGQIFTPPNLLNPGDGSLAKRPVIKAAPRTVGHAGLARVMAITTDTPIKKLNIIRRGTSTHSVDTDQRFIKLSTKLVLKDDVGYHYAPLMLNDPGIAVPGIWMLFAVNEAGVPSVGWTVTVTLP